jgi:hypothetical protein
MRIGKDVKNHFAINLLLNYQDSFFGSVHFTQHVSIDKGVNHLHQSLIKKFNHYIKS